MRLAISAFTVILLVLVIPFVNAQEIQIEKNAEQKLVEVVISAGGEVRVKHIVGSSDVSSQMKLIKGTVENLTISDEIDKEQQHTVEISEDDSVIIAPSKNNAIIEYDLKDVLLFKDNVWTWDFLYLQTTNFYMPAEASPVFINDSAVHLGDKKGFACHGCQMILKYSINQPTKMMEVGWEDQKFLVEIQTFADIENFVFDQSAKQISFRVNFNEDDQNANNQFFTTVIPLELLWRPYVVFLDEEKIFFNEYSNNGTHVWINIQPNAATGEITIVGTTVVPEFPIIAPLAIGFLMILTVPLIRRFNLR